MGAYTALLQIFSGLGLSSAAGLNAYVPLLAVGILARLGIVHLDAPYSMLATWPALMTIGVLAIIDFVADKIPAVDHTVHVIGAVVHPIAGAIVFGSQTHAIGHIPAPLALAAGLLVAGGFHATRAAVRPVSTVATAGMGNPLVSLTEDVTAVVLSVTALLVPVAAFVLFVLLVLTIYRSWRTVRAGLARIFGRKPAATSTL